MSSNLIYSGLSVPVKTGLSRAVGSGARSLALPANQAQGGRVFLPTVRQLVSTFPSNIFSGNGKKTSIIPEIDYIKHLTLRVDVAVSSSSVVLVPTQYWFTQIDLRDTGSGEIIQTQYDDSNMLTVLARCAAGKQNALFKSGLNMESDAIGKYGLNKPLPVGTHTFYIPVLTSVFENFGGLYLQDLQGDLSLDLTTPSTIIASGSGSISTTISFMVEGVVLGDPDIKLSRNVLNTFASECRFLQAHRSDFVNQSVTAGQVCKLPLKTVDGLCAFQAIMVRPTGYKDANVNFNQWKLYNIGDSNGAAIDLTTSSGASLWGNGTPVPTRHIRQHQSVDHFDNDFFSRKPVYLVSYADSIQGALTGQINGGYFFRGSHSDELRLSLPSAPVQEVQTVTFTGTPAAGFYRFEFRGEKSASLAYNASAVQMKAAFEAMREVAARNITVTFSSAASAGASFTATFDDPEGSLSGDLVGVVTDGVGLGVSTARTTAAVPGLASGQYDIYVYSFLYREASFVGNKLRSRLLKP